MFDLLKPITFQEAAASRSLRSGKSVDKLLFT